MTNAVLFCVYVPENYAEQVKEALFAAGAGRLGQYSRCSWQTAGTGQFMPERDSSPFLGEQGNVEKVREIKIEMIGSMDQTSRYIAAVKQSHPYETPAFHYYSINLR